MMVNRSGCWSGATAGMAPRRKARGALPGALRGQAALRGATEPRQPGEGAAAGSGAGTEPGKPFC